MFLVACQGIISEPGAEPGSPGARGTDSDPAPPGPQVTQSQDPAYCDTVVADALGGESQRLDPIELANAVEQLLGFRPRLSPGFPEPIRSTRTYITYPGSNQITKRDIGIVADTADDIALQMLDHLDELLPCERDSIDQACADALIEDLARRAFRGAEDDTDVDGLQALYRTLRSDSPALDPDVAIAGVTSVILQSPAFLYLIERATAEDESRRVLTGIEIANRLAFVFVDGPPDAELLLAAERGDLANPGHRRQQALRLLEQPAAREAVVRFVREWMGLGRLAPEVEPELAAAFDEELRLVVEDAVFGGGSLEELFVRQETFVNGALAEHYSLDAPADWQRVSLPSERRGGLLTLAAVASAHGSTNETSPTKRGLFIRAQMLCEEIPDPPPDAAAMNPVLPEDATVRERIDARMSVSACGNCHRLMDPIGIGLEDLDNLGRYRESYDNGHEVDSAGRLLSVDDDADSPEFNGTAELSTILASSAQLQSCVVVQWFRYAMGRRESDCQTAQAQQRFAESGGDLRELLISLVESDAFVNRGEE